MVKPICVDCRDIIAKQIANINTAYGHGDGSSVFYYEAGVARILNKVAHMYTYIATDRGLCRCRVFLVCRELNVCLEYSPTFCRLPYDGGDNNAQKGYVGVGLH